MSSKIQYSKFHFLIRDGDQIEQGGRGKITQVPLQCVIIVINVVTTIIILPQIIICLVILIPAFGLATIFVFFSPLHFFGHTPPPMLVFRDVAQHGGGACPLYFA